MVGAACGFAGAILLLTFGSALLEWYWVVILFLLGAAVSAWRTWNRVPSHYAVAQEIDRRLHLHDAIATAFIFAHDSHRRQRASADVVAAQRAGAQRLAQDTDVRQAMPIPFPRQTYLALALGVAALSLFIIRFGILGQLDLKAPIVEAFADFFRPAGQVVARNKQPKPPQLPGEEPLTMRVDQLTEQRVPLDQAPDAALNTVDIPDTSQGEAKDASAPKQQQVKAAGEQSGDDLSEGAAAERKGDDAKDGSADSTKGAAADKAGSQQSDPRKPNPQAGNRENSSLIDKMRDAMANLMAKLKVPPQAGQQGKQGANQQQGSQQGQQEQAGGQKGEKGEGQQQGKGTPTDDPNAEQGEGEQQAQAGQGKSSDKGSEQGSPNESKSGMGKQDGDKNLKDNEQVAAMGKITELFGKRAQNVTGEVMVEVSSSKAQQLRTSYAERGATHREAGGEIHRDEIPLVFQDYVQQYFEQVRKAGAAKPPSSPAQNK